MIELPKNVSEKKEDLPFWIKYLAALVPLALAVWGAYEGYVKLSNDNEKNQVEMQKAIAGIEKEKTLSVIEATKLQREKNEGLQLSMELKRLEVSSHNAILSGAQEQTTQELAKLEVEQLKSYQITKIEVDALTARIKKLLYVNDDMEALLTVTAIDEILDPAYGEVQVRSEYKSISIELLFEILMTRLGKTNSVAELEEIHKLLSRFEFNDMQEINLAKIRVKFFKQFEKHIGLLFIEGLKKALNEESRSFNSCFEFVELISSIDQEQEASFKLLSFLSWADLGTWRVSNGKAVSCQVAICDTIFEFKRDIKWAIANSETGGEILKSNSEYLQKKLAQINIDWMKFLILNSSVNDEPYGRDSYSDHIWTTDDYVSFYESVRLSIPENKRRFFEYIDDL